MRWISPTDLSKQLKTGVQLIDVREPYEHAICAIGGKHIPMAEITSRIKELNPSLTTFVLCKTGKRAAAVANLLESDYGFSDVAVLEGGIIAYAEQVDSTLEKYD